VGRALSRHSTEAGAATVTMLGPGAGNAVSDAAWRTSKEHGSRRGRHRILLTKFDLD